MCRWQADDERRQKLHGQLHPPARTRDLVAHRPDIRDRGFDPLRLRDDDEPGWVRGRFDDALLPLDELDLRRQRHRARLPDGWRARRGSTSTATVQLTLPGSLSAGSYYIHARADADSQVAEASETNNTRSSAISIGAPDLVVSTLSRVATGGAGLAITISDTTRNQSSAAPAAPSVTRFYLSADTTVAPGDVAIGSRDIPALQPGASSAGSTSLLIPAATTAGTYYIVAKANDAAVPFAETNVTNNTRSSSIVIGPDMIVSTLTVPSTGGAGMPITVTDTTKNQGAGSTAKVTTTSFYLSANTTVGTGDVLLGSRSVGILGPAARIRCRRR